MKNSFLLKFLELGLFDIGDNDERLDHLKSAIENIKTDLTQNQVKFPQYILVALDKDISPDEPVLIEVETIVTQYWRALRSRYKDRPIVLLRGVILNALFELGNESPQFARIIYLVGSNFYPFASLGKEKDIVLEELQSFGEIAEEYAIKEWALVENITELKLRDLEIKKIEKDHSSIVPDYNKLKESLRKAANSSPNGHGPHHQNYLDSWSKHFSEEASKGLSQALSDSFHSILSSFPTMEIENSINVFFRDFNRSLQQVLNTSINSLIAVERRNKLLWWKETLYSKSQKKSYREIQKAEFLPTIIAYDLFEQLPNITPVSVDYLLRDVFFLLLAKKDKKIAFVEYFKVIQERRDIFIQYFQDAPTSLGRVSITDFVGLLVFEKVKVENFKERTGIDLQSTIKPSDLSVVLLHDLLCKRLIASLILGI